MIGKTLALFGLLTLALAPVAAQEARWIEQYDEASNKLFYYHSETRETQWEEPAGVEIERSIDPRAADAAQSQPAPGQKHQLSATDGSAILMTLTSFAVPIGLFFAVLVYLYIKADKEGLQDVLRNLKKKRDRSSKRKGSKAGSSFRHKFKLSQDGKGGRSANS